MAIELKQQLRLTQQLVMTPQLQQAIKLLQLNRMELVGLVQVFAGLTFVLGRFVPLGLVVYAPVMVNIVGFHLFLDDPAKGVVAYVLLLLYVFVSWVYMPSFRGVLAARGETRAKG